MTVTWASVGKFFGRVAKILPHLYAVYFLYLLHMFVDDFNGWPLASYRAWAVIAQALTKLVGQSAGT
jgi:hypothetical protein